MAADIYVHEKPAFPAKIDDAANGRTCPRAAKVWILSAVLPPPLWQPLRLRAPPPPPSLSPTHACVRLVMPSTTAIEAPPKSALALASSCPRRQIKPWARLCR
eukprot:365705-Chlamydomonas_euryale.AAC.6